MRHMNKGRKLSRSASHRKALFANLATSLFLYERIQTTTPKAKELRSYADKLVTLAKRGDLHARRLAASMLKDPDAVKKLFAEIGPRFAERNGGYTRVIAIGNRKGDNAAMAIIELTDAAEAAAIVAAPVAAPAETAPEA